MYNHSEKIVNDLYVGGIIKYLHLLNGKVALTIEKKSDHILKTDKREIF